MTNLQIAATAAALVLAGLTASFIPIYLLHILILIALYGALALAWNILGGMAGQVSIGHSLFVGFGGYLSTILYLSFGISPWLGMLAGAASGAMLGAVLGFVIFRRKLTGIFFALVTLAVAEMAYFIVSNTDALGAANGLSILPATGLAMFQFNDKRHYFYVALGLLTITILVTILIRRSRLGFHLSAIRENERAAAALGINVDGAKIIAAAISSGLAAPIGTFYAQYVLFIDPESLFGVGFSIEPLTHAFVGGLQSTLGPLFGAVVLIPLSEGLRIILGGRFSGAHLIIYGVVLIGVIRLAPEGLSGALHQILARYKRGNRA